MGPCSRSLRWATVATVPVLLAAAALPAAMLSPARAAGTFANQKLANPQFTGADTEPSIRVAPDGTVYVGAIRGVPSGIDMWRLDAGGVNPTYLGSPDSLVPSTLGVCCAALGGGDMDLAVNADGSLGISSLWLGSITVGRSTDRGQSFLTQPLGGVIPGDDREWNTSDGATMYMSFHDLATGNIDVERSPAGTTAGLVYAPAGLVLGPTDPALNNNELGDIVADRQHPGLVYQVYTTPSTGTGAQNQIRMAVSTDSGSTWTSHTVYTGPAGAGFDSIFPSAAVDRAGNVYVAASDDHHVLVFSSTDHGATWSAPTDVNTSGNAAVFPWVAAGGNGGVVVTWFGADTTDPSNASDNWQVLGAESTNGTAAAPSYALSTVSDHVVRHGIICQSGLSCTDGRQLGDFFQVAVGPDGIANVAWSDDGAGDPSVVYYARGGVNLGPAN